MATAAETRGWKFSLGGIPVVLRPEFLIIPVVGAASGTLPEGVAWVAIVLVSVLWHELGHALAMKAFGYAPWIDLHAMGGATHWPQAARPTPTHRFLVTFAGPAAGLLLGVAVLAVRARVPEDAGELTRFAIAQLIWVNIGWSLINLLPVLPWDGGHVLDSGLELVTGAPRPRTVGVVGLVASVGVLAGAAWLESVLLGYFGVMGLVASWQRFQWKPGPGQGDVGRVVVDHLLAGRTAEAEALAAASIGGEADEARRTELVELMAWARLFRGDLPGARDAAKAHTRRSELLTRLLEAQSMEELVDRLAAAPMLPMQGHALLVSYWVIRGEHPRLVERCGQWTSAGAATPEVQRWAVQYAAERLFHAGAFEPALAVCTLGFERLKEPSLGFNAACCLARLGRVDEGLRMLTAAVEAGYSDVASLTTDEDLAALRTLPGFEGVVRRLRSAAGQ
ncbi:MAG: site-2 protease family protein [Myxococcota bacterium]